MADPKAEMVGSGVDNNEFELQTKKYTNKRRPGKSRQKESPRRNRKSKQNCNQEHQEQTRKTNKHTIQTENSTHNDLTKDKGKHKD